MKASSPHRILNPSSLPPPRGFSHVIIPTGGKTVYVAGQTGHRVDGTLAGPGHIEQLDQACANAVEALLAAGGRPEHLVSVLMFVTDLPTYRAALSQAGEVWQKHFGKHYPAVSLFEVAGMFEPGAKVELVCTAVVPG